MKKILLLLLAGGLTFSSCTKTGPQGPRGYTGNANVIGEDPFTVTAWSLSSDGVYYASIPDNNITNDVVDYGLVEIYKEYSNGWTNLPDINGITSTVFNFTPGNFVISILNSNGTTPSFPGTVSFRVVVVPSSIRKAYPNTNWKDYNATEAVLATFKTAKAIELN